MARKLRGFFAGPRQVEPNLWVYTPLVLPFPYTPAAIAVNRWILRATIGALRAWLGMRDFQRLLPVSLIPRKLSGASDEAAVVETVQGRT